MRALVIALGCAAVLAIPGTVRAQHGSGHGGGPPMVQHAPTDGDEGGHAVHVNWWNIRPAAGEGQPFLATLFNFLVLGLVLGRFAYPPLREYLESRHHEVAKEIEEASRLRAEAAAKLAVCEKKLEAIDHDIARLLAGIRAAAEAEKAHILAAAEEQAARLRAEAEFTITQDLKRFRKEIEHEVIAAAMTQARKLLAERIGESDQRALADRYLASLATAPISADGPATPRGGAA